MNKERPLGMLRVILWVERDPFWCFHGSCFLGDLLGCWGSCFVCCELSEVPQDHKLD